MHDRRHRWEIARHVGEERGIVGVRENERINPERHASTNSRAAVDGAMHPAPSLIRRHDGEREKIKLRAVHPPIHHQARLAATQRGAAVRLDFRISARDVPDAELIDLALEVCAAA